VYFFSLHTWVKEILQPLLGNKTQRQCTMRGPQGFINEATMGGVTRDHFSLIT